MIVADASVAVDALLNDGPARRRIEGSEICAPHLIDYEVANALRRLTLGGLVTNETADDRLSRWAALTVERFPARGLLPRIWELRSHLSAYDAAYAALAEALDCPLVTGDSRLASNHGERCTIELLPREYTVPARATVAS